MCPMVFLCIACSAAKYTLPYYDKIWPPYDSLRFITISERVGDTIDYNEMQQFKLFSKMKGCESAIFYGVERFCYSSFCNWKDTIGYIVEVTTTDGKKYRTYGSDYTHVKFLRKYVDDYEKIAPVLKQYEKIWHIVDYDDALGLPITNDEIDGYMYGHNYNATFYGLACCGISCITGSLAIINIFNNDALTKDNEAAYASMGIVTGIGISTFAGFSYGKRFDRAEIVKAIKAGRRLKPVE